VAGLDQVLGDEVTGVIGRQEVASTGQQSSSALLPLPATYVAEGGEAPGVYPFTRGPNAHMYHEKLWVMGQYSGFATPEETNRRFRDLLAAGQTGLSIALDLPTQLGMDSDAPLAAGEVGKVGVPLDTVDDLLVLLDGVPFDQVRQVRTTANSIGPLFVAMFEVALEELGVDPDSFRLIVQNDPLKEYLARGTFIFPPGPGVSLAVDVIEHFAAHRTHWEPIEFCGYHIRDAGGNAIHEVAIATANGIAYLDAARERGIDIDEVAGNLYLFLSASTDIFEEAAKLRAARRLWGKLLVERYGVDATRAAINLFVYTLGGALTAQEPDNNVVRVTCEALAAVLGGVQTLATSSYDEALGLPSPHAAHIALRTQQVIAYESGATRVIDPLAGSYYVEDLTDRLEAAIDEAVGKIAAGGGAVQMLEAGELHRTLADAAYQQQADIESGARPVVGVNVAVGESAGQVRGAFRVDPELERGKVERLAAIRRGRSDERVAAALDAVREAAANGANTIPVLRAAARERVTLGEMISAMETVYGRFRASSAF
jgi:methylmalonyl-CoA mutase N-terminal domain/subunit